MTFFIFLIYFGKINIGNKAMSPANSLQMVGYMIYSTVGKNARDICKEMFMMPEKLVEKIRHFEKNSANKMMIVILVFTILVIVIQYLIHGSGYVEKNSWLEFKSMIMDILVIAFCAYTHECGHFVAVKHYMPELKKNAFKFTKLLFIPIPIAIEVENAKRMNAIKQIIVRFAGVFGGMIPLIILYFFDQSDLVLIFVLYLGVCGKDFYDIFVMSKYIIVTRKISLEDN
jgi:hypothetical protein